MSPLVYLAFSVFAAGGGCWPWPTRRTFATAARSTQRDLGGALARYIYSGVVVVDLVVDPSGRTFLLFSSNSCSRSTLVVMCRFYLPLRTPSRDRPFFLHSLRFTFFVNISFTQTLLFTRCHRKRSYLLFRYNRRLNTEKSAVSTCLAAFAFESGLKFQ